MRVDICDIVDLELFLAETGEVLKGCVGEWVVGVEDGDGGSRKSTHMGEIWWLMI